LLLEGSSLNLDTEHNSFTMANYIVVSKIVHHDLQDRLVIVQEKVSLITNHLQILVSAGKDHSGSKMTVKDLSLIRK